MIYSTTLGNVDALLSDSSKLCLVESEERLVELLSSPFRPHQISVYVIKKLYSDAKLKDSFSELHTRLVSVIPVGTLPQFGEIVARCALQLQDPTFRRVSSNPPQNPNGLLISKTLQKIPGLGPKHASKLLTKFGSLYHVTNASVAELEGVLGPNLGMTVYQFLH